MPTRSSHPRGRVAKRITVPGNLQIACEQFNTGQYYECHETLEEIWQEEPGDIRDLYKGLIQLAAAFVHLTRANYTGAERLLRTSRGYLAPYAPAAMGFDVANLVQAADALLAEVQHLGPAGIERFDLARAPVWRLDEAAIGPSARAYRAWGFTPAGVAAEQTIEVIE
ncbi:MAG: DUF309 domain-containing protein [Dehalococcoidia bacterium]